MTVLLDFSLTEGGPYGSFFIQEKVCRVNLNYSSYICENLHDGHHIEEMENVQIETSEIFMQRSLMHKVPAIIFLMLLGEKVT